jgi:hypothetical protein
MAVFKELSRDGELGEAQAFSFFLWLNLLVILQ